MFTRRVFTIEMSISRPALLILSIAACGAQSFEVASIKPNAANDHRVSIQMQPGGRFTATGINTRLLMTQAFDIRDFQIANAPRTPVFIDGRLTPYVATGVLADYTTVLGVHPGWRDVIARRGIKQLLVRPADPVAVRARDLGWPIRASSDTFVLIDVP